MMGALHLLTAVSYDVAVTANAYAIGTYYIVTECAAYNGVDDPRREDVMVVSGPGAPA